MTFSPLKRWPHVSRNSADISNLTGGVYGVDAEWDIRTNKPSVLGISDGERIVCVNFNKGADRFAALARGDNRWILHNGLQADLPVFREQGIDIDPNSVDDTILWHWLTSPNLCKTKAKSQDDESERRGAGFLNLYSMCSIYTDAPNWKACRGDLCDGPCPEHDVFGYCGNDAYWPMIALPKMKKVAQLRGVDKLYAMNRDASVVFSEMSQRGVFTDVRKTEELRESFKADRERIKGQLSFNPNSPKQVLEKWPFLDDTTEDTIAEAAAEYNDPELTLLAEYKELGKGVDSWLAPLEFNYKSNRWSGYVDKAGYVHPRFGMFTSSGRCNCVGPNFQNVAKNSRIRECIVAPEGMQIVEADYSNAENRVFMWMAGYTDLPKDLHSWVVELVGITAEDEFAKAYPGKDGRPSPRQAAKSFAHASHYGEGLALLTREKLRSPDIRAQVAKGCRLVFEDWTFGGKYVSFTGVNLAKRAFGKATVETRRKALDIQQKYFRAFPRLRDLQRRITCEVDRERMVKPPSGLFVPSYGEPEDRIKTALAIFGSQPVAHLSKLALLESRKQTDLIPVMQIHDAIVYYCDKGLSPKRVQEACTEMMVLDCGDMLGLRIPIDIKVGDSWDKMHDLVV